MTVTASTDTVVTTGSSAVVVKGAVTIAASSITAPKASGRRGVAAPMPARAGGTASRGSSSCPAAAPIVARPIRAAAAGTEHRTSHPAGQGAARTADRPRASASI